MRANERDAAAGNDSFFDGRARCVHRIFDASLLLLHFGFGRRADFDHRDAADQLRQPLLQFLAIVVGSGLFDLRAELLHAAFDGRRLAGAFDDRRVVLVDDDLLGACRDLRAGRSPA